MRFIVFCLFAGLLGAGLALPQTGGVNSAKKRMATRKTSGKKSTASSAARTGKGTRGRTAAAAGSYRQMAPTAERYKEIQQALVDKGYLKSEPTGVWDQQSSDAMKQFQTDQKQNPTGKITSAALIGLGLGPKPSSNPESVQAAGAEAATAPLPAAN